MRPRFAIAPLLAPLLALVVISRPASAGVCLSDQEADDGMRAIEAFAASKAKKGAVDEMYGWLCVSLDARRFRPRIEKACRKILDRDGLPSPCVGLAAAAGFAKLGDDDSVPVVIGWRADPLVSGGGVGLTREQLLGRMGDPRGLTALLDEWKAAIPRAAARERKKRSMAAWSAWRQHAAEAIGALGSADELPFLEEQMKATKDRHVRKACRDAIAAIQKRTAP